LFCLRVLYCCLCRVETDEEGITFHRPLQAPLKAAWAEIRSVRYWHSALSQGGLIISTNSGNIRIYRWIERYPMLNRLLRDRLRAEVWPGTRTLPLKIPMNGSRSALIPPAAVVAGAALTVARAGTGGLLSGTLIIPLLVPVLVAGCIVLFSGRMIEITADSLTDSYWAPGRRKTTAYRRSELEDMRLARQVTVGGLWLRFGYLRLEITNMDAGVAPEEILATLQREWKDETIPEAEREQSWVLAEVRA
jgi:hypothetical protein